jgi:hypothetical protein
MDKSIFMLIISNHSPGFKPWAMMKLTNKPNRFNGL